MQRIWNDRYRVGILGILEGFVEWVKDLGNYSPGIVVGFQAGFCILEISFW